MFDWVQNLSDLALIKYETLGLWIQAIVYFMATVVLQTVQGKVKSQQNGWKTTDRVPDVLR